MSADVHQAIAEPIGLFELTRFLEGHVSAWGVFEDRFGRLRRSFTVQMHGQWRGPEFHLDELFIYDDGREEHRLWRVTPAEGGKFTATSDDCVGVAHGQCTPSTIQMSYRFRLKLPSRVVDVDFDDRIYRINGRTAVNRATMRKWGIKLGELSLFFERQEDQAKAA